MSPCFNMKTANGTAIICTGRGRTKKCACGRASTKLCDYIVSPPEQITHRRTCDKPLCDNCAHHVSGKDLDYCGVHADKLGVSLIL
jgi:hypothetical protein